MKKSKILTLIIAFIFFQNLFSQSDYREGFIITTTQDTIKGLIDFRDGYKNNESCMFKKEEKEDFIIYSPEQISAYGFIDDRFYESKIEPDSTNINKPQFFEVLVKGKASLYRLRGGLYINKDNGKIYKLSNESVGEIKENGKVYDKKSNRYIGILKLLLSDCSDIKLKFDNLSLTERALTKIVGKYNNCLGQSGITYKKSVNWVSFHYGLIFGLNSSVINFEKEFQIGDHLSSGFDRVNSIMPGVSMEVLFPRFSERVSFHLDVFYLTAKYVAFNTIETTTPTSFANDVTIELEQLKIPFGIRYTFPERSFTPFFNLGVSYTYHLKESSSWIQQVERDNIVNTFIYSRALELQGSQTGLWIGIGLKKTIVNKLQGFVEIRYEQTSNFALNTQGAIFNHDIKNTQLLIGISF
jgi:hypothetical protein